MIFFLASEPRNQIEDLSMVLRKFNLTGENHTIFSIKVFLKRCTLVYDLMEVQNELNSEIKKKKKTK